MEECMGPSAHQWERLFPLLSSTPYPRVRRPPMCACEICSSPSSFRTSQASVLRTYEVFLAYTLFFVVSGKP